MIKIHPTYEEDIKALGGLNDQHYETNQPRAEPCIRSC